MSFYSDAAVAVRFEIEKFHQDELDRLSTVGTWWDAQQRVALIEEARTARYKAGLQAYARTDSDARTIADIPAVASTIARTVAAKPQAIDREFFDRAMSSGLSEEAYVEVVSIAASITNLDIFAAAIGIPPRGLSVHDAGTPSRKRPATATSEGAFAATIPSGQRGGEEGRALYGPRPAGNITRSASVVPDEAKTVMRAIATQYVALEKFDDLSFTFDAHITRSQVEFLAARVSVLNDCFY